MMHESTEIFRAAIFETCLHLKCEMYSADHQLQVIVVGDLHAKFLMEVQKLCTAVRVVRMTGIILVAGPR